MGATEHEIQHRLAKNLDVVEPGLELLGVEVRLKNPLGSTGRIDILAKDRFGNRVIIELKRSNQSARDAIHEINKYMALFRMQHGLATSRLRCIIASTEWKELRVPFSEYVASSIHQVQGCLLVVDEQGDVTSAEKIEPTSLNQGMKFFLAHSIYLYAEMSRRDAELQELARQFESSSASGFVLIEVERFDEDLRIPYPYGIYLALSRFEPKVEAEWRAEYCEAYGYDHDEVETVNFDDHCLALIAKDVNVSYDSFEIGNSEKLHTILGAGWRASTVHRFGNVQSTLAASDDELLDRLKGHEGEHVGFFTRMSKPEFELDWSNIVSDGKKSLVGNPAWTHGFDWFCETVDTQFPKSSVAILTYNPLFLPITLFKLATSHDARYVPSLELIVLDDTSQRMLIVTGSISWDGKTHPTIESAFGCFDEGVWGYFTENHMNLAWEKDADLMAAHGLRYSLICTEFDGDEVSQTQLELSAYDLEPPLDSSSALSIQAFVLENADYIAALTSEMQNMAFGL